MKKTTKLFLAIGCLTALSIVSQAQPVTIVNGDFEANTTKTPFFNSTGGIVGVVPGWTPAGIGEWSWGTPPGGDSGVDLASGSDPTTHMYLAGYDPAVYQLTSTAVGANIYALNFSLGGEWSSEGDHKTLVTIYADDGLGDVATIGTTLIDFGDNYTMNNYEFYAVSTLDSSYGNVGVSFQNVTLNNVDGSAPGWGTSYTTVDNVSFTDLSISNAPEPGTLALLTLGGLAALVGIRRRS